MVVIVFRSRVRAGTEEGLVADGERMYQPRTYACYLRARASLEQD